MKGFVALLSLAMLLAGCTTYPIAQRVKLISFTDEPVKGKSVGPIRGEDCVWSVLGYKLGGNPTLDKAMASARTQTKTGVLDTFSSKTATMNENVVQYMNNVSTENEGWDAVVVGKQCLIVKGVGYR